MTSYGYDKVNRLESIVATNSAGAPITSFDYILGPTGNRKEIAELDGTVKSYDYDDLYRLKTETVTLGGAPRWSNVFDYDPVGNRKTQDRVEIGRQLAERRLYLRRSRPLDGRRYLELRLGF